MTAVKLRFDWEWRTTVAVVLLVPLFVSLGFWQLQRAEEKKALQALFAQRAAAPAVALGSVWSETEDQLAYLPVTISGQFLSGRNFLLDNQMNRSRYGFHLLSPLQLDDGRLVLINRGWLPGDPARRSLPEIEPVAGRVTLAATVYVPPGEPYQLADTGVEQQWPRVIQIVDTKELAQALPGELFPYTLRIAPEAPEALAADWPVVNVSPAKHQGYALQWFTMAGALLIVFVLASTNIRQWLAGEKERND